MKEIVIRILGVDYKIKQSFRALSLFEEITGKRIDEANDTVTDTLKLFYCIIKASNKSYFGTYDEFIDMIDEEPESVQIFINYLQDQAKTVEEPVTTKKKKSHLK